MCADSYTKAMSNRDTWNKLRMLINIFKQEELTNGEFSPDVMQFDPDSGQHKPIESVLNPEILEKLQGRYPLNMHYYAAMQGESTKYTDFRKPVKVKTKRPKVKLKPIPTNAAFCSTTGVVSSDRSSLGQPSVNSLFDDINDTWQKKIDEEFNPTGFSQQRSGLSDLMLDIN